MLAEKTSPFQIIPDGTFIVKEFDNETGRDSERLEELMGKEYGIIELLIIKALYKYQVLNRYNLEKVIDLSLENRLKKPKYVSNIKALEKRGFICQADYCVDFNDTQRTTLFFLSRGSYEYMRKNYPKKPVTYLPHNEEKIIDFGRIAEIMERMSLNQWHINMLCNYSIKDEGYYGKRRVGLNKVWLRSHMRVRTNKGKYLTVIAIPAVKDQEQIEDTLAELAKIGEKTAEIGKEALIIVLLCDSVRKIEKLAELIFQKSKIQPTVLYAVDMNTAELPCLTNLYQCKQESGITKLDNYEIGICCEEKSDYFNS